MEEYDPTMRRHPGLFEEIWSAVIVDESHKILPAKTSEAGKQSQIRSGIQKIPVRPRRNNLSVEKLALSGTPWRGNPLNQWGTLNWLYPEQHSAFWDYAERWFTVEENGDYRTVEVVRPSSAQAFGEEIDVSMLRRTKAEVAPWLPSKVYAGTRLDPKDRHSPIGVWLDMGPKQAKAYDEMTANAVARLESGELQAIGVLAEMTRQKQFASCHGDVTQVLRKIPGGDLKEWVDTFAYGLPSNKWDWIVEFLDERGIITPTPQQKPWGDGKVVIGSWQTGLLNIFKAQFDRMKIPSLIITGETKNADRSTAKAKFQKPGGPRVMLLNTIAGGVSLTLDRADDMVVVDRTWVPDDMEQLEDRIHRISRGEQRAPATYWYLNSRGTIDEHIAEMSDAKDRIQKELMDGRRGVDFAKKLLTGGQ
jgi:SNF2 family DNA or RNA helicase